MRSIKINKILCLLSAACIMLSACNTAKSDTEPNQSQSVNSNADTSTLSQDNAKNTDNSDNQASAPRDSENVKFLYEKPHTEQPPVGIYNGEYADISEEKYIELFSETPECDRQTYPEVKRRNDEYKSSDETGMISYTNGVFQNVNYYTKQGLNYMAVADGSGTSDTETEFDFISRDELSDKIKSIAQNLFGIDIKLTIDAVTEKRFSSEAAERLKFEAELYGNASSPDKYGAPIDFYAVSFVQTVDGVPFEGSFGTAVYSANGLEYLYIGAPIKITSAVIASTDFISLDGAENLLKEKYELLFLMSLKNL